MAEDKVEQREVNLRQLLPWTELFRGFQVALDPKKLLLAAGGILVMALGWLMLAALFGSQSKPLWDVHYNDLITKYKKEGMDDEQAQKLAWSKYREDLDKWNILWRAAGSTDVPEYTDAGDLASSPQEWDRLAKSTLNDEIKQMREAAEKHRQVALAGATYEIRQKPAGELRTLPWFEDRGPNPFLMVTGQIAKPWETGQFWDWFLTKQAPVLVEPLVKFFTPVVLLLNPRSGTLNRLYFLLVILWTLATWALFGGAITRMASVQLARNEKVGMREAVKFVQSRYLSFFSAPVFPLIFIAITVVLLSLYGFVYMIPWLGDIVIAGLGWPIVLLAGLAMAVVLVGLVGWPMMYATISAEGSDAFDAISRSYSYVYQNPWNYAWYSLVGIGYGAVVVFFVGFMGSAVVYLGKWGVSQTPFVEAANREPSFLFAYAPVSFHWRTLLLDGAKVDGQDIVQNGKINPVAYAKYTGRDPNYTGKDQMTWANKTGAFLVGFWLYAFFLVILGFGYSYFWSASTIVYLLMRRKVDDTDMDEIYLEEDESEEAYSTGPTISKPAVTGGAGTSITTMVETPTLRSSAAPPASSSPKPAEASAATPAHDGDKATKEKDATS